LPANRVHPVHSLGPFSPVVTSLSASGVKMTSYAEAVGFGGRKNGDLWETDVAIDVAVKDKDGAVLQRAQDFTKQRVGSPRGECIVGSIMRDKVTGKSGTPSLPFIVR